MAIAAPETATEDGIAPLALSQAQEALAEAFRQVVLHSWVRLKAERALIAAVTSHRSWNPDVDEDAAAFELASYRVIAATAPFLIGEVMSGRMTIGGLRSGDWRRYTDAMKAAYQRGGIAADLRPF